MSKYVELMENISDVNDVLLVDWHSTRLPAVAVDVNLRSAGSVQTPVLLRNDLNAELERIVCWFVSLYRKSDPTYSAALALVRKELWAYATLRRSPEKPTQQESRGSSPSA